MHLWNQHAGTLVIRFVAAVKDVGAQRFEGASFIGWSTTSRPGKVFHDAGWGAVSLNFATGGASVAQSSAAGASPRPLLNATLAVFVIETTQRLPQKVLTSSRKVEEL